MFNLVEIAQSIFELEQNHAVSRCVTQIDRRKKKKKKKIFKDLEQAGPEDLLVTSAVHSAIYKQAKYICNNLKF